jgi:hypothetical protein
MNTDDHMSFKEFSTTLDVNQIPVYMERWQRFNGDSMGEKHFAAMRKRKLTSLGHPDHGAPLRKAILVLVGGHFAYALDRVYVPAFQGAPGPGGPALIDYAASSGNRRGAEAYLSLEGSYGQINCGGGDRQSGGAKWNIAKSTHPWREGRCLFDGDEGGSSGVTLLHRPDTPSCSDSSSGSYPQGVSMTSDVPEASSLTLQWGGFEWSVFENTFSIAELRSMFGSMVTILPDERRVKCIQSRL